jgi:hypothetical protein
VVEQPTPFHIETVSGKFVDPWDLKVEDIDIDDIAFALSNVGRFTGHVRTTVAAHSVLVASVLREFGVCKHGRYLGLMHDAHEAYLGDVSGPVCMRPEMAEFCRAKERAQAIIDEALPGPARPIECCKECSVCYKGIQKQIDFVTCMVEAWLNLPSRGETWSRATRDNCTIRDKILGMFVKYTVPQSLASGIMSRDMSGVRFRARYSDLVG